MYLRHIFVVHRLHSGTFTYVAHRVHYYRDGICGYSVLYSYAQLPLPLSCKMSLVVMLYSLLC